MKNVFLTLSIIALIGTIVFVGLKIDNKSYSTFLYYFAVLIFCLAAYYGYFENMRSAIGMLVYGGGAIWSGSKTIETIDFSKPFMLSFYWATLGYLLLTLFLIFMTVGSYIEASEDPERI